MVQEYIAGVKESLSEVSAEQVEEIVDIIVNAWVRRKRIFVMGNGGSATTASHFARDLQIGTGRENKPRIRAVCLTDSVALITSLANDKDYASIFSEQLTDQLEPGDVVIGISASGNSLNVLKAIEYAREKGAITIGLVGFGGGRLKALADKAIVLSKKDYRQVEDVHMVLAHVISCLVGERIAHGK